MPNSSPSLKQINITFERLLPRVKSCFKENITEKPETWDIFFHRLSEFFPRLFRLYYQLYADQYDFYFHLEDLLCTIARMWYIRPAKLKDLDRSRVHDPLWFQSNRMIGGVCYVDLFAGNLTGIRKKISYFKELGLTYLHLMPLFLVPSGENDGGYAISSYRAVDPKVGTIDQLALLADELRANGISLVLDLVLNHTSNEHEWALKTLAGDIEYEDYYRIFPDRSLPDAYELHLREIFPDEHPGAFTYNKKIGKWVWTTFHSYQWDLNYANPAVFNRMAEEMLFLANLGAEVLRLDAVAFIWKELGTNCENLPEAHLLLKSFNAVTRIAAPALVLKSEAIVHPDEVNKYIAADECQLSYNPLLMALLWNSLATRQVRLLKLSLSERFEIHPECSWVNYVRVHDDIGWTFSDEDAARLWVNASDHRQFLNQFYTGQFTGSFARGLSFQENQKTGDSRISGTCASLAGLEKALTEETEIEVELAIRRILLIHGIILTVGGIPLIYLGDEIGRLNEYNYRNHPSKSSDSRWVHRPPTDWEKVGRRNNPGTIEGEIFQRLSHLISIRKKNPVFSGGEIQVLELNNDHVLGFIHFHNDQNVTVLANFSEKEQFLAANLLEQCGLDNHYIDLITSSPVNLDDFHLHAYQLSCLKRDSGDKL